MNIAQDVTLWISPAPSAKAAEKLYELFPEATVGWSSGKGFIAMPIEESKMAAIKAKLAKHGFTVKRVGVES